MKKNPFVRISALLLTLLLTLSALSSCGFLTAGFNFDVDFGGGTEKSTEAEENVTPLPEGASFSIHFIDVGQADAILIRCDDQTMLIDGGNAEDSNVIYSVLKANQITHLDYIVCTHEHEDHAGGLLGALTAATVGTAIIPLEQPINGNKSDRYIKFLNKVKETGGTLQVAKKGQTFNLGSAGVTVLAPIAETDDVNETSVVLRVVFGKTSFLFTGDAGRVSEKAMLDAGVTLKSTLLKVGHHGSAGSTTYNFLKEVDPEVGIIMVGTGNTYGHPTEAALSRLRDADVTLYRTDLQGDIFVTSDGEKLTVTTKRNAVTPVNPTDTGETRQGVSEYAAIGNLNSKVYHTPTCSNLPAEANRIYFTTNEEAEQAGYKPCGSCHR